MIFSSKRISSILLSALVFILTPAQAFAAEVEQNHYTLRTYNENGHTITEGDRLLDTRSRDITGSFSESVGVDADRSDYGPWNYGTDVFLVFSQYINPKYLHGTSVRGNELKRSDLMPRGIPASISAQKNPSDNHAYWRVAQ